MDNLPGYFSHNGSLYKEVCVVDMLEGCLIDHPGLERLLVSIKESWMNDMGPPGETGSQCCVSFYRVFQWLSNKQVFLQQSAEVYSSNNNWYKKVSVVIHSHQLY